MNFFVNCRTTITRRLYVLVGILASIFFGVLVLSYYYISEQEQKIYSGTYSQFEKEISAVIELQDDSNFANVEDIAYWDDCVDYVKTRDADWFDQNIVYAIGTYRADYLGIYDADGNFVNKHSTKRIATADFIPKQAFEVLKRKRMYKFHVRIPEGYAQVFGASVHPTRDVNNRVTPAEGFFFIVKLLDEQYFKNVERVYNAQISFAPGISGNDYEQLTVVRDLAGYDGKAVATLTYSRPFDVSFGLTKNMVQILMAVFLLSITVFFAMSYRWISLPLRLITNILENGKRTDLDYLRNVPGEFRYIGKLLREHGAQQEKLKKAKAKAEESDRLKSSFLTNISHEIRTPMNAIAGFSDLLLQGNVSEAERCEYIKIINSSGKNLVSIIDDLIEMSKIDTNQVIPNYGPVDVDACLAEIYRWIKISIPSTKNLDFQIRKPVNGLSRKIITDEVKLRQVLINLITNAIKYTDSGFVLVGYEANLRDSQIEFIIQDSGIGISKAHHEKIFQRFHRIESDYTIKAGGLGLGLAISKAYVQMLGGDITFDSGEMTGTTFTFRIPLNYAAEIQEPACEEHHRCDSHGLTILVAEDDSINFLLIQKILQSGNHMIIRARDGQEAVDLCADPQIDLVLMDIKMPVLDGYQAMAGIKMLRPSLPVIAQTAYASVEDSTKMRDAGFDGYVSKPIDRDKLFDAISMVMAERSNV